MDGTGRERTRPRSPRGQGARLRAEIVDAATAIVDETGSTSSVTLRAIARRVGISAPSIYPHFAGPSAIMLAVVQAEFSRLHDHIRAAPDAGPGDPVGRLRAICSAYLDFARRWPHRYLLLLGGIWDAAPAVADAELDGSEVAELGQVILADLAAALGACVESGESTSSDPDTDAVGLWLGLHGLAHQRIVSTQLRWPDGLEDRMVRQLGCLRPAASAGTGRP